jgi:hypothetical protein
VHGYGSGIVSLSASSVDQCQLGDLVAFILAELPLFSEGRLLGLACLIVAQFGEWLTQVIHKLAPPQRLVDIPALRGMTRARLLDTRQLSYLATRLEKDQSQSYGLKHQHKLMVYMYCQSFARKLASAPSRTLHVLTDGWRSVGEAMDLFFPISPWTLDCGFWPFTVTLSFALPDSSR